MGLLAMLIPVDHFHLDPEYFPETTKDFLSVDDILKYGALPLGFKRGSWVRTHTWLNVGFLGPRIRVTVREVEENIRKAHKTITGLHPYKISINEYLVVLERVYHLSRSDLRKRDPDTLSEPLKGLIFPSLN